VSVKQALPRLGSKLRSDRGQDAVEYVLLVILIALAITAGIMALANSIDHSYNDAAACIANPTQGGSQGKGGGQGLPGQGKGKGGANPCP
jgi:Flp pilus assembly pilin Flp